MINKISGKRSPAEVKHLQVGDKEIMAVADIAGTSRNRFQRFPPTSTIHQNFSHTKPMMNVNLSNLIHTIWKHTALFSL